MVRGFEKLSFGQTLAGSATYISQLILSRNKCKERVKQNEKVIRTTTILFTLIYGEQPMSSFMPLFFRISRVMAIFTACIWFYKVFTFRDTASIYPMRNRVQKRSVTQYYFTESKRIPRRMSEQNNRVHNDACITYYTQIHVKNKCY